MPKPVVLVAEELAPSALAVLADDFEVRQVDGADRAALLPALADVDAVIVRSATMIDAEALAAASRLKVVARAGVGLDNVDVAGRDRPRRARGQRADVQHRVRRRACGRPAARGRAAGAAGIGEPARGGVEAQQVHRRRDHRQDRRRRRPRSHRCAVRAADVVRSAPGCSPTTPTFPPPARRRSACGWCRSTSCCARATSSRSTCRRRRRRSVSSASASSRCASPASSSSTPRVAGCSTSTRSRRR